MLLRCPSCDTAHELDEGLFARGPRRVRCASCREIWEASPETPVSDPEADLSWDMPEPAKAEAEPVGQGSVSQAELDAMFGEDPPPERAEAPPEHETPVEVAPEPRPEPTKTDARKRRRDEDRPAMEIVQRAAVVLNEAEPEKITIERQSAPAQRVHAEKAEVTSKLGRVATTVLTSFTGVLIAFGVFRHDVVRIAPATAPIYEMVGLGVNTFGLEIHKVQSRIFYEDGREALEVSGEIINITSSVKQVPVLRLSLRGKDGQELYVWTGTADRQQIQAKEKTLFRRRLAAPPSEADSVLVRFIAQDDIVAAIHANRSR